MNFNTDNIIIFGAGASYDAGIPLLGDFMQKMWEISARNQHNTIELKEAERLILAQAMKVARNMDGYHGRVSFDDRNIEEILSMLYFEKLENEDKNSDIALFNNAIAKVIELTCNVEYVAPSEHYYEGVSHVALYRTMWNRLFSFYEKTGTIPVLVSLNYDLVLERSFFNAIHAKKIENEFGLPFGQFTWNYNNGNDVPIHYLKMNVVEDAKSRSSNSNRRYIACISSHEQKSKMNKERLNINMLKLHGSLNSGNPKSVEALTKVVSEPQIIPPIVNKSSDENIKKVWSSAIKYLRKAKNVVFVGYSLPQTDLYMQYFLRSGFGPNTNLNKISVFDPVLWTDSQANNDMRGRFSSIFSQQIRNRIEFNPKPYLELSENPKSGTMAHFVHQLFDVTNNGYKGLLF